MLYIKGAHNKVHGIVIMFYSIITSKFLNITIIGEERIRHCQFSLKTSMSPMMVILFCHTFLNYLNQLYIIKHEMIIVSLRETNKVIKSMEDNFF